MVGGSAVLQRISGLLLATALCAPLPAAADCTLSQIAQIPVAVADLRPIVSAQVNGRPARFILDTGAAFTTIAKANATQLGLPFRPAGSQVRLAGVGGDTTLGVARVETFTLSGLTVHGVSIAVGGGDSGYSGLLGQDLLGVGDIELDLPHDSVRLLRGQACKLENRAYWADDRPVALVPLETTTNGPPRAFGSVLVNGVKIRALFDTGAMGSVMTLAAARHAGVGPQSPSATPDGFIYGAGRDRAHLWRARFQTIDIGGELIRNPMLRIAEGSLGGAEMLIGMDYLQTHRLLVDNQNHRLFITYEGGAVFGVEPGKAPGAADGAPVLGAESGEPTDAAGYSRRGASLASSGELAAAIADFDKAVQLAPDQADYRFQRARAYVADHRPGRAIEDLDQAIALAPNDPEPRLLRARLRLNSVPPADPSLDLSAADSALAPTSQSRLTLAELYAAENALPLALKSYDLWLDSHPEDSMRPVALGGRCWTRALLRRDLDAALDDCETAHRLRPDEPRYLGGRALTHFQRGEYAQAIADDDAVIAAQPRNAWSLLVRSLAERRAGKTGEADTDRALALSYDPHVIDQARRYGLNDQS